MKDTSGDRSVWDSLVAAGEGENIKKPMSKWHKRFLGRDLTVSDTALGYVQCLLNVARGFLTF